jgi:hypothetical protein
VGKYDDDGLDARVVEVLAAADEVGEAPAHYAAKHVHRPWYQRVFTNTATVVILITLSALVLAYSVWINEKAITRVDTQAKAAKAAAAAAASKQLGALQLICSMERDIRVNSHRLSPSERANLKRYDVELQCTDNLKKPRVPLTIPSPRSTGGGQGGAVTPPSHPRAKPSARPSPSSSPQPSPSRSPRPSPSPSPTPTCITHVPVTGQCVSLPPTFAMLPPVELMERTHRCHQHFLSLATRWVPLLLSL